MDDESEHCLLPGSLQHRVMGFGVRQTGILSPLGHLVTMWPDGLLALTSSSVRVGIISPLCVGNISDAADMKTIQSAWYIVGTLNIRFLPWKRSEVDRSINNDRQDIRATGRGKQEREWEGLKEGFESGAHRVENGAPWVQKSFSKAQQMLNIIGLFLKALEHVFLLLKEVKFRNTWKIYVFQFNWIRVPWSQLSAFCPPGCWVLGKKENQVADTLKFWVNWLSFC